MSSWHRQYRGRSVGRILHFVYWYCGFDCAEVCLVGVDSITYHGQKIATYKFLSDTDIPHFTFLEHKSYSGTNMQEYYEQRQQENLASAIQDADDTKPELCSKCRTLEFEVKMLRDIYTKRD